VLIQIPHPQVSKHDETRQANIDKRMGHSRNVAASNYERLKNRKCTEIGGAAIASDFYFGRQVDRDIDDIDVAGQMALVRNHYILSGASHGN